MAKILIDGYNLLAATPHPDRDRLIRALSDYSRAKQHKVTIVFDGTHAGFGSGERTMTGGVEVIFTALTVTADDLIEEMLPRLDANVTLVVSSDRRIQNAARAARMTPVSSEEFAIRLGSAPRPFERNEIPPWMEGRTEREPPRRREKKGTAKKLPKEERRKRKKLRDL